MLPDGVVLRCQVGQREKTFKILQASTVHVQQQQDWSDNLQSLANHKQAVMQLFHLLLFSVCQLQFLLNKLDKQMYPLSRKSHLGVNADGDASESMRGLDPTKFCPFESQ